jgi:hypothetical protein
MLPIHTIHTIHCQEAAQLATGPCERYRIVGHPDIALSTVAVVVVSDYFHYTSAIIA